MLYINFVAKSALQIYRFNPIYATKIYTNGTK